VTPGGILYSFRRCPYAIRARLALAAAGVQVEVREVTPRAKPPELLAASAKGTVPVLARPDGEVLEESLDIVLWALGQRPEGEEARETLTHGPAAALIAECDGPFKRHLDAYRYGDHGRKEHREAAAEILRRWSALLEAPLVGLEALGWILLPFVRQFRLSDPEAFAQDSHMEALSRWLAGFEGGAALETVMAPPWGRRQIWRSPRWLYHLALEGDWQEARRRGVYLRSTRGMGIEEVGFIHASWSQQVEPTWRRFYGDGPELRLLVIEPARLTAAGLEVREEAAPESGERFPHIYGALPIEAVLLAERFAPLPEVGSP